MRHGVWILAGVLFMAAVAAAPASISLGGSVSLPTVGMRFRVFREMKPMPLPLPAIVAKRRSDGVNLVDSLEYWRFRQTAGVWFNDVGEIRVGALLFPPLAEAQLKSEGVEYTKGSFPLQANSRARAYDQPDGLIKVLADKKTSGLWGERVRDR